MGHRITAVIGGPDAIARIARLAGCPAPTQLPFGLEIVPLGHAQIDALTALQPGAYFADSHLSEGLQSALLAAAGDGTVAYIETGYFGGAGGQAAAVFAAGEVTMRAATPLGREAADADGPINTALHALGVVPAAGQDAFEAIGLAQYRDMESLGLIEDDDD